MFDPLWWPKLVRNSCSPNFIYSESLPYNFYIWKDVFYFQHYSYIWVKNVKMMNFFLRFLVNSRWTYWCSRWFEKKRSLDNISHHRFQYICYAFNSLKNVPSVHVKNNIKSATGTVTKPRETKASLSWQRYAISRKIHATHTRPVLALRTKH